MDGTGRGPGGAILPPPARMDGERVAQLVERLVKGVVARELGTEAPPALCGQLVHYSLRILGSRLTPSFVHDEFRMSELIKKRLLREGRKEDALQCTDLLRTLSTFDVLRRKSAILHVLLALASESTPSEDTALVQSLETVFADVGLRVVHEVESHYDTEASTPEPTPVKHRQPLPKAAVADEVNEDVLVRDVLFALQGIDGKYVRYDGHHDAYVVVSGEVSPSKKVLIRELCELGWLYRRLQTHLDRMTAQESIGLVGQSLVAALHEELRDYYRLIAILQAQTTASSSAGSALTLRRLMVWSLDPVQRLRLMNILVDSTEGLKGGALASAIHGHLCHGDSFVHSLVHRVMSRIVSPLFYMIRQWVFEGELEDPHCEFFVASDPAVKEDRLWQDKYSLREAMVPSFITTDLAHKILLIGKSINFIRHCCHDAEWVADASTSAVDIAKMEFGEVGTITEVITRTANVTNRHVMELLFHRYKFQEHCMAMKCYLLLGQGDFIQYLFDVVSPELSKPATGLYRHNLLGMLETAIRASNAQYDDPDVLNRLDVRLLENNEATSGWDVFALDYHVNAPINAIFTPEIMGSYQVISNFLWKLKRAEVSLSSVWRRHMMSAHIVVQLADMKEDLRMCHMLRHEMIHFINNLQYYIMFEVMEASWQVFLQDLTTANHLDDIIDAHSKFLRRILDCSLLNSDDEVLSLLNDILQLINRFRGIQEALYSAAEEGAERRNRALQARHEHKLMQKWGVAGEVEAMASAEQLLVPLAETPVRKLSPATKRELQAIAHEYREGLSCLLKAGGPTQNNLRFLKFRLDFNEHYVAERPGGRSLDDMSTPRLVEDIGALAAGGRIDSV